MLGGWEGRRASGSGLRSVRSGHEREIATIACSVGWKDVHIGKAGVYLRATPHRAANADCHIRDLLAGREPSLYLPIQSLSLAAFWCCCCCCCSRSLRQRASAYDKDKDTPKRLARKDRGSAGCVIRRAETENGKMERKARNERKKEAVHGWGAVGVPAEEAT